MGELTIIIDSWGHDELKEYLMSLNGILDVFITSENQLEIYIKYNPDLITTKIIKLEILLFLGLLKIPSTLAFDKHSNVLTVEYLIIKDDICCSYCFKGAIDDLFEIEGIEKVETNFSEEKCHQSNYNKREKFIINIKYNPDLISAKEMKTIELKLNI